MEEVFPLLDTGPGQSFSAGKMKGHCGIRHPHLEIRLWCPFESVKLFLQTEGFFVAGRQSHWWVWFAQNCLRDKRHLLEGQADRVGLFPGSAEAWFLYALLAATLLF